MTELKRLVLESLFTPVLTIYTKSSDDFAEREDNTDIGLCRARAS
jgi:hypothetical protein